MDIGYIRSLTTEGLKKRRREVENIRKLIAAFIPSNYLSLGYPCRYNFSRVDRQIIVKALLIPGQTVTEFNDANKFRGTFAMFPYRSSDKKTTNESIMSSLKDDFGNFGVEFSICSCRKKDDKNLLIDVRGERKVRMIKIINPEAPLKRAMVSDAEEYGAEYFEIAGLRRDIEEMIKKMMSGDAVAKCISEKNISFFADSAIAISRNALKGEDGFTEAELRELFKELNIAKRLKMIFSKFGAKLKKMEEEETSKRIKEKANDEMANQYRRAILTAQKKEIEKELGFGSSEGGGEDGQDDWEKRIEEAGMTPEAEKMARHELGLYKLNINHQSEAEVHRKYLEYLCNYPWNKSTEDNLDLIYAREILLADHYGLAHVNKRIIEYLAVRKLKPDKKGPILCFGGPPGTGKTHCGKAAARALNREFVRISLGGVKDEAVIRGHRRTYVGALPGRIIEGMIKAGTKNPVYLLDEIDKLGNDGSHGDPAAALLEVLDPEQNHSFSDHYLEVCTDLSQVIFICTSNFNENIPLTLRDRLEILDFPGYTMQEKMGIAKTFLIPKQMEENGLADCGVEFADDAISTIINQYTEEAGVRNLEREIAAALRNRVVRICEGKPYKKIIAREELPDILGPVRFEEQKIIDTDVPGVVTGLAFTPAGGCTLIIEAVKMKKKGEVGELIITGNLRDIMRESVMVSYDCARAYSAKMGYIEDPAEKWDIHLHCDDHEIGKNGPSAGGAITLAFISLFTGKRVRNDLAMTGEIILRGKIWPVGGIKQKVLAAHRAGYKHIFIPKRNKKDLIEISDEVKSGLNIMFAETIGDIAKFALLPR